MKLYAISDLHLFSEANRQALKALPAFPDDWLALAGDIGETENHLHFALSFLTRRFRRVLWTPGNHDLWTLPSDRSGLRGEVRYQRLVAICRDYGVSTPEDPYLTWKGEGPECLLAPIFTLYDYSFRPEEIPAHKALEWAAESGVICSDEILLFPDPYPTRPAWCAQRCAVTEAQLEKAVWRGPLVLIGHFPLRYDLARLERIPRFSLWCGTRRTEDWHTRYKALAVVYGHLHIPSTQYRDGVRFEEVSFGYPQNWSREKGMLPYLREILPGPTAVRAPEG